MPEETGKRAVNVIHLESKGKEKMEEAKVMPIERVKTKKAWVSEELIGPSASMETKEEGTAKKKRKTPTTKKKTAEKKKTEKKKKK